MLVVPDSQYSLHVPVLIGTNILGSMMEQLNKEHGERFLQTVEHFDQPMVYVIQMFDSKRKGTSEE